mgnify:CR=1 FL=1
MDKETIEKGRSIAITSYILIIGVLIALSMNIRQSLGLSLTFLALSIIVPNFGNISVELPMWIFIMVLWSYGIITAVKGQTTPVPLLGTFFQKIFKGIQNY